MEKYTEINENYARDVFNAAKNVFGDGIYVESNVHPCGWDFVSFKDYKDYEEIEDNYGFYLDDISNGIYNEHPFEDRTLLNILEEVEMDGWCFEKQQISW